MKKTLLFALILSFVSLLAMPAADVDAASFDWSDCEPIHSDFCNYLGYVWHGYKGLSVRLSKIDPAWACTYGMQIKEEDPALCGYKFVAYEITPFDANGNQIYESGLMNVTLDMLKIDCIENITTARVYQKTYGGIYEKIPATNIGTEKVTFHTSTWADPVFIIAYKTADVKVDADAR